MTTSVELLWISPGQLHPNDYNPNVLDDDLYQKAKASIEKYGFVDPVTVREVDHRYIIIDGEHRVRAALELGLKLVPVIILDVDDDVAQQLTLVLNELHGRPDQVRLTRLLANLSARHPVESLLATLPFAREQFSAAAVLPGLPHRPPPATDVIRWVERMYRLPRPAADVLDQALAQAKQFEEVGNDWQALEAIAKRYIDGD